ncbi:MULTISPECIES: dTDP-4-dehydrorhamnose 3,5-epimerase [unclassified Oceanispirochaeta]|uniref:dTDP-4-dehydrorhamnose 3,5-epimerase n=1 Tax=unclassified Oceanispirochaeta TaxID=2635722 RepID=UPI000E09AE47|nr:MULTISPECIES: dTDP-4-dehydrorhamnose 3,5-epimerase [unclassified Oceanispirochaeta]MBF9017760.1 dTDP-4-dehydrorhamnose 3,5-epimerase [Oceanispirochaeta sp. M2]NPD74324.1 dTDP-4-dehydrorhamnose 3,5-epimerase [Oceanispirochaeta sp. M1]RDG29804.1 dTDP-4-dehydrorhamnose 3,5-epimerase [Oceanispirochaeta sp. M1]
MPFDFKETSIPGVIIIQPRKFGDDRGFFMETYKQSDFVAAGITESFCQDNHSLSSKGVLRGVHFQSAPHAQGKLLRVLAGAVWDVAVDLIPGSPTFGQHVGVELTGENGTMFYIPPGFGHGFLTLSDNTHFLYKCTEEYAPSSDGGVKWDDPDLAVKWPLQTGQVPLVSDKDAILPYLKDLSL